MRKANPLKLTLVVIPLAIVVTLLIRLIFGAVTGQSMHPALALVIYIVLFAVLKIVSEKMVDRGKLPWLSNQEK